MQGLHIEVSKEQIDQYTAQVEKLISERKRQGSLLSTFDLVAGAGLLYFCSGNNNSLPAKWIFAAGIGGLLPDGLLERARKLDHLLSETEEALAEMDGFVDKINSISNSAYNLRRSLREIEQEMRRMEKSISIAAQIAGEQNDENEPS